MRAFVRNNRVMVGPLGENDLVRLSNHSLFENHGISAVSGRNGVEIFATLPETDGLLSRINEWYLAHHVEFSS